MGFIGSLITAGLSAFNPVFGIVATVFNFVVDERSSGASAFLSIASNLIGLGGHGSSCGDLVGHAGASTARDSVLCSALEITTSVATDLAMEALTSSGQPRIIRCGTPGCRNSDVLKVLSPSGRTMCRACFEKRSKGVVLQDGSSFDAERFHDGQRLVLAPDNAASPGPAFVGATKLDEREARLLLLPPQQRKVLQSVLAVQEKAAAAKQRISEFMGMRPPTGGFAETIAVWMGPVDQPSYRERYRAAEAASRAAFQYWMEHVERAEKQIGNQRPESAASLYRERKQLVKAFDGTPHALLDLIGMIAAQVEEAARTLGLPA